jgi:hypothetical protein
LGGIFFVILPVILLIIFQLVARNVKVLYVCVGFVHTLSLCCPLYTTREVGVEVEIIFLIKQRFSVFTKFMTLLRAELLAADIRTALRNESLNLSVCYVTPKDRTLFTGVFMESIAFIFRIRKSKEFCHAGTCECILCYSGRKIHKMELKFPLSL